MITNLAFKNCISLTRQGSDNFLQPWKVLKWILKEWMMGFGNHNKVAFSWLWYMSLYQHGLRLNQEILTFVSGPVCFKKAQSLSKAQMSKLHCLLVVRDFTCTSQVSVHMNVIPISLGMFPQVQVYFSSIFQNPKCTPCQRLTRGGVSHSGLAM